MPILMPIADLNSLYLDYSSVQVDIRWRTITYQNYIGIPEVKSNLSYQVSPIINNSYYGVPTITENSWNTGGGAGAEKSISKNPATYVGRKFATVMKYIVSDGSKKRRDIIVAPAITEGNQYFLYFQELQIDWSTTLASLRASYPPETYNIESAAFYNSYTDEYIDLIRSGEVNIEELRAAYKDTESQFTQRLFADALWDGFTRKYIRINLMENAPPPLPTEEIYDVLVFTGFNISRLSIHGDNPTFVSEAESLGDNESTVDAVTLPMQLKVWFSPKAGVNREEPESIANGTNDPSSPANINNIDTDTDNDVVSDNSSLGEGLNPTTTYYGNNLISFDSVYMSGANYNSFLAAGGGIVSESGIFPNGQYFYVDKIRLDVEGSSATIIELVDFDAVPSLVEGEKLYIYILNEAGDSQPAMCGYVNSIKKELTDKGDKIIYEIKDMKYYLEQYHTPDVVYYQPPEQNSSDSGKTIDIIVKEVLNNIGFSNALVNLPIHPSPAINWNYESIGSVMEWACNYFGKYMYYIDKNGLLNIKATDSGSVIKSFRIPTRGEAIGTHKVLNFSPITDLSRSRSRIILTGDYSLEEKSIIKTFAFPLLISGQEVRPEDATETGLYWYRATSGNGFIPDGTIIYYFIIIPNQTLNDKLLSDESTSAKVTLLSQQYIDQLVSTFNSVTNTGGTLVVNSYPIDIPITVFDNTPGRSKIYCENSIFSPRLNQTIKFEYCVKSNAPIQEVIDTGYSGGVEVIKKPEFKRIISPVGNIDDTALMTVYLNTIKEFYKPIYGGSLVIDGLDNDLYLLGKLNITNTGLTSKECTDLIIWAIEYDIPAKKTTIELSNKVYLDLPFFDIKRDTTKIKTEEAQKARLVAKQTLYGKFHSI
jgi:hypothetical protein